MGIDQFVAEDELSDDELFEIALRNGECDEFMEGSE